MKCIIIEDQAPAQQILQRYISRTAELTLEKTFCDALEAKEYLKDNPVDLVFLDIDLPRFSGMDFLRSVQGHPLTILTTAYAEFALESYQFNVVDYLLKPFSFERFSHAIGKVTTMAFSIKQLTIRTEPANGEYVYVKSSHNLMKVNKEQIVFIKSDSDYTEIVTTSNTYLTCESLKDWLAKLDDTFQQVHKSYIINTVHLQKIAGNRLYLDTCQIIPLGRAYKKQFLGRTLQLTG